jgi:L-asparaginase II
MRAYPGQILAKVGAEGVYGAVLLERGLGVALKVEDGHSWAAIVALLAILDSLKLDPLPTRTLSGFANPPTVNTRGETVGTLRAAGSLTLD